MPDLLVVDRRLPQVNKLIASTDATAGRPVGAGGLRLVTATDTEFAELREKYPVMADTTMATPTIVLRGAPMDVHGESIPDWTRHGIRSRLNANDRTAGEGVLVGSVDTGIQRHEWLDGGYLSAPDDFENAVPKSPEEARNGKVPARPEIGHGTFVAGLVLQQAPAAGIWVERALSASGEASASAVAHAATRLARRGVDVLNLSLGCYADEPNARAVMQRMVDDLHTINPQMVIVAAAGNLAERAGGGFEHPREFWPAALDNVVAVGAVTAPDSRKLVEWSNRGSWLDVAAPGVHLLSTYVSGYLPEDGKVVHYEGWANWSGTSFAAAVVSGAIARLMNGPGQITAAEAVARLQDGELSSGWTDPDDGVLPVPIVALETWRPPQSS